MWSVQVRSVVQDAEQLGLSHSSWRQAMEETVSVDGREESVKV